MPSILIVDDDADLSAIVARYLESEGFAVERAASAEEAMEKETFDLRLLAENCPVPMPKVLYKRAFSMRSLLFIARSGENVGAGLWVDVFWAP